VALACYSTHNALFGSHVALACRSMLLASMPHEYVCYVHLETSDVSYFTLRLGGCSTQLIRRHILGYNLPIEVLNVVIFAEL